MPVADTPGSTSFGCQRGCRVTERALAAGQCPDAALRRLPRPCRRSGRRGGFNTHSPASAELCGSSELPGCEPAGRADRRDQADPAENTILLRPQQACLLHAHWLAGWSSGII